MGKPRVYVTRINLLGNCDIPIPIRPQRDWADFNQDGQVNTGDALAFNAARAAGLTAADLTVDGIIDGADEEVFLRIYAAVRGGPP